MVTIARIGPKERLRSQARSETLVDGLFFTRVIAAQQRFFRKGARS